MNHSEQKIQFDYIKSNDYRTIHADGAYGGLSSSTKIFMAVYSERPPIPKTIVHEVLGSKLGPEIRDLRVSRLGFVREVEVGISIDVEVAKTMVTWLQQKIQQIEDLKTPQDADSAIEGLQ